MDRSGIYRLFLKLLFLCVLSMLMGSTSVVRVSGEQNIGYSDKQILDTLLNSNKYDKRVRPSELTVVNVTMMLLTMSSPDESSFEYSVEFLVHQTWSDSRLKNYDSPHQNLNGYAHIDEVWRPDIYLIKHGEVEYSGDPNHVALKIDRSGTVTYTMRKSLALNCFGDLKIFPFDNVKCPFSLESLSHDQNELELQWAKTEDVLTKATSFRQKNAYLTKNATGECDFSHTWRGNYSCLQVLLVFARDQSFYSTAVFMPEIAFVLISFISFWLAIKEVAARIMIGLITMLTFTISNINFRSTLEVTSDLTALNRWDGICFFFIFASIIEFVIVNYLYRKHTRSLKGSDGHARAESQVEDPAPVDGTTSASAKEESPTSNSGVRTGKAAAAAASVLEWFQFDRQNPSVFIDNLSRIVFPLIFFIFVLAFFIDLA